MWTLAACSRVLVTVLSWAKRVAIALYCIAVWALAIRGIEDAIVVAPKKRFQTLTAQAGPDICICVGAVAFIYAIGKVWYTASFNSDDAGETAGNGAALKNSMRVAGNVLMAIWGAQWQPGMPLIRS